MSDTLISYSLRVEKELLEKLGYIAKVEARSKNKEIVQLIKEKIRDFEAKHGKIKLT